MTATATPGWKVRPSTISGRPTISCRPSATSLAAGFLATCLANAARAPAGSGPADEAGDRTRRGGPGHITHRRGEPTGFLRRMPGIGCSEGNRCHHLQLLRRPWPDRSGTRLFSGGNHLPGLRRRGGENHRPVPQLPRQRTTPIDVQLQVDVPPGVESGMWLQLRNQGELGDIGAPRGNLRIQVVVKRHPFFERRRNDLVSARFRSVFAQAALGGEIEVPTLDGRDMSGSARHPKRRGDPDQGPRHARYQRPRPGRRTRRGCGRDSASPDAPTGRVAAGVCRDRALAGQSPTQELLREAARLLHRGEPRPRRSATTTEPQHPDRFPGGRPEMLAVKRGET